MCKKISLMVFSIVASVVACGTDASDPANSESQPIQKEGEPGGNTAAPPVLACDCPEGHECMQIEGKRVSEDRLCSEPMQFVTCYESPTQCIDEFMLSRAPSGDLWLFPSSCIPSDWQSDWEISRVDNSCFGAWTSTYCHSLGEEECAKQTGCGAMTARRACELGECPVLEEFASCVASVVRGCGQAITLASDLSGELWCFTDTCIPPGWTEEFGLNAVEKCLGM